MYDKLTLIEIYESLTVFSYRSKTGHARSISYRYKYGRRNFI